MNVHVNVQAICDTLLYMSHKKHETYTRKIIQNGRGSYYLNIPKEIMDELDWQERQKLTVTRNGKTLEIKDWKG